MECSHEIIKTNLSVHYWQVYFLFEHKYVLIKATRYNKLGNDLIGGKVLDFKQLENKFEKKKVNTFLVYQKGELTTEYYKTPE
ncbi:6-aminohexanoate hydrolase, partial [Bacillus paranthracis]|nr:6-aminohexanoate hydrolase [Bacillus paranthracis]